MTATDQVSADLAAAARQARGDVDAALRLPESHPAAFPLPGSGSTWRLWTSLAVLGSVDLTVARAVEPHLDALAILAEARAAGHRVEEADEERARWGVFAAEGPGSRLVADESTDPTTLSVAQALVLARRLARPRPRDGVVR